MLLIPGVVGHQLLRRLTGRLVNSAFDHVADIVLLAVLSYIGAWAWFQFQWLWLDYWPTIGIYDAILDEESPLPLRVISLATGFSIVGSALLATAERNDGLTSFLRRFRLTNRTHLDLWHRLHLLHNEYIWVRDDENGITYEGIVQEYSETGRRRELVLVHVKVFKTMDGSELYAVPRIYLPFDERSPVIEIPTAQSHCTEKKDNVKRQSGSQQGDNQGREGEQCEADPAISSPSASTSATPTHEGREVVSSVRKK